MRRISKPSPAGSPVLTGPVLKSRTFQCMGTVISLALPTGTNGTGGTSDATRDVLVLEGATAAVERVFTGLDAMFSLYRPDSEASRMARGEVTLREASAAYRARFEDATGWRLLTEGFFTPERPDGVLDGGSSPPSGPTACWTGVLHPRSARQPPPWSPPASSTGA